MEAALPCNHILTCSDYNDNDFNYNHPMLMCGDYGFCLLFEVQRHFSCRVRMLL